MFIKLSTIILIVLQFKSIISDHCIKEYFNQNSFVCACDSFSCPSIPETTKPPKGYIDQWTSSKSQYRFNFNRYKIDRISRPFNYHPSLEVTLNLNDKRQIIHGFGGAFTDSTGINLLSLPINLRDHIMKDYFTKNGLDYSVGRVPIGGCDFSPRIYTYDDIPDGEVDFDLKHFSLQPEDIRLKIPMIQKAYELKNGSLRLISSSWSSPAWMKTNDNITGSGFLKGSPGGPYYKAWARYLVKFLDSYAEKGIKFWALTTQNEPTQDIINRNFFYNSLGITPDQMLGWIKYDLGPELEKSGYGTDKLNLLLLDDIRQFLPNYTKILKDEIVASYVTGIAIHWYTDDNKAHYEQLDITHNQFPKHFIISTEAAEGYEKFSHRRAQLGNWTRAETYAKDIIEDINRYTTGWVDWNLVLDTKGGPSWANNPTDGLILVDAHLAKYYRNPMFYSLGHFSKFIQPDSVYIGHQVKGNSKGIYLIAVQDPTNQLVIVILNTNDNPVNIIINNFASISVPITMDGHSIKTILTPSR